MASSLLKIKRSASSTVPVQLYPGELAYSAAEATGNGTSQGVLFIGGPTAAETGYAATVYKIGGTRFTNLLDVTAGTVSAGKALVVDADGKLDKLKLGTLEGVKQPDGTTVLTIGAAGSTTQKIIINDPYVKNAAGDIVSLSSFIDELVKGGILTLEAGDGISEITNNNGTYRIALKATGVTAGTYGSATRTTTIKVNQYGQLTEVTENEISTKLSTSNGDGTTVGNVDLINGSLKVTDGITLDTSVEGTTTFKADSTVVRTAGAQSVAGQKTFSTTPQSTADQALQGDAAAADNELLKVKTAKAALIYTDESANGATVTVGGVVKGKKYADTPIMQILDDILHPYVAPSAFRMTLAPTNGGVFEKGTTINLTSGTVSWSAGSQNVNKVEIKNGSNVLGSNSLSSAATSSNVTFTLAVKDTTTVSSTITDPTKSYAGANVTFTYVYPLYHGTTTTEVPTATEIQAMTKHVETKGTKTYSFTANNARCVFAYPASYGNVSKIFDPNNFDVTSTFTKSTDSITGLDGTAQTYNVYVNSASTVTNFNFKFQF